MATVIREVVKVVVKLIDNRIEEDWDTTIKEILKIVKSHRPCNSEPAALREGYRTGRNPGARAVTNIDHENGRAVSWYRASLQALQGRGGIQQICRAVRRSADGITYIGDESSGGCGLTFSSVAG